MRDNRHEILHFWFEETEPTLWFQQNDAFDERLRHHFLGACELARDGLCDSWKNDPDGCLALILLLHQFPRNIWRGHAKAYDGDAKALLAAKHAVAKGFDQMLPAGKRRFIYLPFLHSEKLPDQRRSVELFAKMQKEDPLSHEHALRNFRVIEKFGRFPHRNRVLDRENSPEENDYLAGTAARF